MLIYDNEYETKKIEPRIKLNYNIHIPINFVPFVLRETLSNSEVSSELKDYHPGPSCSKVG